MFSFGSPFSYEYSRPKQSFGLFEDDPFSSGYYVRERPSLFRSSSFRQPTRCYQPTYQPSFQQCRKPESNYESSDDEEYDPFLSLFGLRSSTSPNKKQDVKSNQVKSNQVKSNQVKSNQVKSNEIKSNQVKPNQLKSNKMNEIKEERQTKSAIPKLSSVNQIKELDSQRFDLEDAIEYRFNNYKCENPSGISVKITKDGYIVLKTEDNYEWKCRLPNEVDVNKASCTCVKNILSLRLPRLASIKNEEPKIKNDVKMESKKEENNKMDKIEKINDKTEIKDKEYDPDEPIVEDIIEDDIYN